MFRHELEYLCNKEYKEWYDSLFEPDNNEKVEKAAEELVNQIIDAGNYPDKPTTIEIKPYKPFSRDVL